MDGEVAEHAAGGGDELLGGRLRVMAAQRDEVDVADGPRLDEAPRLHVGRVEASLEAELEGHAGGLDVTADGDGLGEAGRQRLLAEGRAGRGRWLPG